MRDSWATLSLGEVAEVLDRMRKPISGAEREKRLGNVPYYGATGQTGWIDKPLFDEELVLLGEDAIDFLNPEVHKAYLIDGPSWVNNHAHVLRARKNIILSYFLMEALNAVDYSQFVAFGTRSKLTQGSMTGIRIPVPPLLVQRRIVDLVASVDAYIDGLEKQVEATRTARNAVLRELLSAGGNDWTETTLGDIAVFYNGKAYKQDELLADGKYRVLRVGNFFSNGNWYWSNLELDSNKYCDRGDLLYAWSASFGPRIWSEEKAIYHYHIWKVVEDPLRVGKKFLYYWLEDDVQRLKRDAGTGSIMMHITKGEIEARAVLLPQLTEQKRIVEIVSSMDDVIQSTERTVADAKNLRSGLLSNLLSGEHEIPESYDKLMGTA